MPIDPTIRYADFATVTAALLSPLIALQVSSWLQHRREARARKIQIFRTLMSTRATALAPAHVEALNLIEIEFDRKKPDQKRVVESWRLYHAHLCAPVDGAWGMRRFDLLVDMLHEMARCLDYDFDKAQIKTSAYIPLDFGTTETEQIDLRRALLAAFQGGQLRIMVPQAPPAQQQVQR